MKITQTVEKEINFPYFCKSENGFVKIISEKEAIEINFNSVIVQVYSWSGESLVNRVAREYPLPSTETEFMEAVQDFVPRYIKIAQKTLENTMKDFEKILQPLLKTETQDL